MPNNFRHEYCRRKSAPKSTARNCGMLATKNGTKSSLPKNVASARKSGTCQNVMTKSQGPAIMSLTECQCQIVTDKKSLTNWRSQFDDAPAPRVYVTRARDVPRFRARAVFQACPVFQPPPHPPRVGGVGVFQGCSKSAHKKKPAG